MKKIKFVVIQKNGTDEIQKYEKQALVFCFGYEDKSVSLNQFVMNCQSEVSKQVESQYFEIYTDAFSEDRSLKLLADCKK